VARTPGDRMHGGLNAAFKSGALQR